ncbi:MAG TPA: FAD-dependent oxidoreductase [Jatrophihabitans sp.]|nr:FAD-dependent oxidoreductase [Jatrophihabitans sp.]
MRRRQIAVVGAGVAGLTAAYVLQRQADVTLYEAEDRLGGHAHTHELAGSDGRTVNVDTGFIVHNRVTYPYLLRLFAELDIATQDSEMSMSVSCAGCGLQYAGGNGLSGLFPTAGNAMNPRYLRLLTEVPRFHRQARALLAGGSDEGDGAGVGAGETETMREFLRRGRFSEYFRSHFVAPLISAVWSCAPRLAHDYPARYLLEFLGNHGMLSIGGSHRWRTVVGGSQRYVAQAAKQLSAVRTATAVRAVIRHADGTDVHDDGDDCHRFDAVVIATHPDQALAVLHDPTVLQRRTLAAFGYSANSAVLHTDTGLLPRAGRARASWNYTMPSCRADAAAVRVSYDLSRLQRLAGDTRYLLTLNADDQIGEPAVLRRMSYQHPIYTPESVAAQRDLPRLGDAGLAFAGAYHGWGFHEDGCRSGVEAARRLGVDW